MPTLECLEHFTALASDLGPSAPRYATDDLIPKLVTDLERLLPGCAAAFFHYDWDSRLVTRRAAGPCWRTAEVDAPAWLAPHVDALANLLKPSGPFVRLQPDTPRVGTSDLQCFRYPVVVQGCWWGTVLVVARADRQGRPSDAWVVGAYVSQVAQLLDHPHLRRIA